MIYVLPSHILSILQVNRECLIEKAFWFFRRFKYLSSASFGHASWFNGSDKYQEGLRIQSTLDRTRCTQGLDFTCRFLSFEIHLLILPQSEIN